jgi:hypothetical protein
LYLWFAASSLALTPPLSSLLGKKFVKDEKTPVPLRPMDPGWSFVDRLSQRLLDFTKARA